MEKYNLEQTGQEVQNILNEATLQSELTAETERAQEAERLLGEGIQQNATDIDSIEGKIPSAATPENKLTDKEYVDGQVDDEKNRAQGAEGTLQDNIDTEEARAKAAEKQNADDIDALEAVVPSGATSENKLATESYVNDAVATSSATFRGTFNLVSDLHLTMEATHANIATALAAAIATADNNDFAFVLIPVDTDTPTVIGSIERYKFNGTDWSYEYTLNNSGFTQAQWNAINSGITSGDVAKLAALPTNAQLTTLLAGLQSDIDGEEARAKAAELALQGNIDAEETRAKAAEKQNADDIDAIEAVIPESASSENKVATESEINSLSAAIEAILLLIPSAATSLNKLADKAFVNSSIATATATFRGTYNLVNDLGLTTSATHAQIATALAGAILTADNNDYAFVQIPTSDAMPTEIAKTERYKFNGAAWEYEYDLNNSGFTADQWAAINSGITQALVTKLSALPTNAQLTTEIGTLTSGINTINQKIPSAASQANKLVDTAAMESYIVEVLNVLTISYNVTSTDGHVTFHIEQVDGKITSVTLATFDIASDAALNLKASQADLTALEGRVTTAEGVITSHGVRISENEADIAILQDAYAGLTQSDIIIGSLPGSGVRNKIYRVPGTTSYSDYMWNGSTWVLMATYNNAIDPRPKKASQNLVTSGGVFDNMGALDVSELNATENPHTLAQYVDLSAALAAVPTDYQKGGMSIKFVQSSDNKYIQARCMAQNFTTDVTQWQGVDNEPTAGSDNLVKSGGVFDAVTNVVNSERERAELAEQNLQDNIDNIKDETLQENRQMVNSIMENYAPVEITGDVNNAADEEDLTSVNIGGTDVLKFKDKVYNPLVYSGLGRKILRKNIVNGVNTLTQSMMQATNTIYVIRYDFTLGENITIPSDCVLEFEGGSLSNGNVVLTNTLLSGDIKFLNIVATGTIANDTITPKDFGAVGDGTTNDTIAFRSALAVCDNIYIPSGTYLVDYGSDGSTEIGIVITRSNIHIKMDSDTILKTTVPPAENPYNGFANVITVMGPGVVNGVDTRIENFTLEGGTILGSRSHFTIDEEPDTYHRLENYCGLAIRFCNNVLIKDCTITDNTGDAIYTCAVDNITIENVITRRCRRGSFSIGLDNGIYIKNCDIELSCYVEYPNGNYSYAISPMAAICFEPEPYTLTRISDSPIENCTIENCKFTDVANEHLQSTLFILGACENLLIRNNIFSNCRLRSFRLQPVHPHEDIAIRYAKDVVFENNTVKCVAASSASDINAFARIDAIGKVIFRNNNIYNLPLGLFYNFTELYIEGNKCFGADTLVMHAEALSSLEKGVIYIINNYGENICACKNFGNKQDLYIINNIFKGTAQNINAVTTLASQDSSVPNLYIENNNISLPVSFIVRKSITDTGYLLLKNNTIDLHPSVGSVLWFDTTGATQYVKADIIDNHISANGNNINRPGGTTQIMRVINNVFAGSIWRFTSDDKDTEHLILSGNVYDGVVRNTHGISSKRPTMSSNYNIGFMYLDETLNKPIWWNGTTWVDSTGTPV